ncbi:methyltransferase [Paractinoplanes rishiriensis]|uniref:Methyltransferase n=1 Tax=Paractinoplanes rishiriensis TaxID=1050105 RepID=A0A919K715_9ACTN|nr:methyltransferase [Actinoplanes rishiriensis]GIF00533.1 methyltransferase [Actinoplanes rishiriensis]
MSDEPQRVFAPADETGPPGPARIIDLMAGYMVSKTLFAAIEVGLFAAADTARTPAELGERCGIPERSARAMADLLADAGVLVRDGDRFRNAPDAETFLAGRTPFDMRPLARYWDLVSYPAWTHATEAFRTRRGVRPELDKIQTEAYEAAVALVTAETAADLARAYDFGPHRRLLDVGGGIGTFVRPILAAHGHLTATLVDLPQVAAVVPPADRLTAVGADLFTDPLPGGHDVVLVANVLHLFPPEQITALLRRLREVIAPDGRLLLVDWWRTERVPHPSARFGAGEFLMIGGGDLYQVDEVAGWLAETGWRYTGVQPLPAPSGVILAQP